MESNDNNRLEDLLRKMYANEEEAVDNSDDIGGDDMSAIIDEEWQKFEAKHFGSEKPHYSLFTIHSRSSPRYLSVC
ncbi:MAG: hypothetical protein IJV25_05405 [Prevotella sp.]|nr:hypothetical protein [Prevotella sp.]